MTYTVLFVIALICVSGFVAYFGDLLGRKMGKKRLTLFKMRPRHTAIVVTTITGMLISAIALTTLISVNDQFRRVFFRGEQIIKHNNRLIKANQNLAKLGDKLRTEVTRQKQELAAAFKDAKLAKKQRDLAKSAVTRLQQQIAVRQRELADLRMRKQITESELKQKRSELGLMQAQLDRVQDQLRLAQVRVAQTEQQLGAAEAKLKDTQDRLMVSSLQEAMATDMALGLRFKDIAFRQGDELARGIINPSLTDTELRHEIHLLLEKASDKALEEGAKVGPNGRAVNLRYQKFTDKADALLIGSDEATNVKNAADKIATVNTDVLVQVVCGTNALRNESVPVEVRLYLNVISFKGGDLIASATIDGRQSEGYILLALNSFLQTDVAKAAMAAGIVPVAGQDARTALGANRQAQADELLDLVAKIKAMNAIADVSVYATGDVRAADTLNMSNIRFTVEKAK